MEPFYPTIERREQDEARERRLQQIEYFLERLPENIVAQVRSTVGGELVFPTDLIVEGEEDTEVLATESEAWDLDPSVAYHVIDTTPGPQARRMPAAVNAVQPLHIKRVGPHSATIYPQAGESLDGEDRLVLARNQTAVELVSDGVDEWRIFGMYLPPEDLKGTLLLLLLELRKQTIQLALLTDEEVTDADAEPIEE